MPARIHQRAFWEGGALVAVKGLLSAISGLYALISGLAMLRWLLISLLVIRLIFHFFDPFSN